MAFRVILGQTGEGLEREITDKDNKKDSKARPGKRGVH